MQELDLEERSPPRPCVRELPRPPVPPGSPALPLSEEQVPAPRENVGSRKSPGISGSFSSHLQVYFLVHFATEVSEIARKMRCQRCQRCRRKQQRKVQNLRNAANLRNQRPGFRCFYLCNSSGKAQSCGKLDVLRGIRVCCWLIYFIDIKYIHIITTIIIRVIMIMIIKRVIIIVIIIINNICIYIYCPMI